MPCIETHDLRKIYRSLKKQPGVWGSIKGLFTRQSEEKVAVKGINLCVNEGELVGFLGPNGAGKTTTLKMLSGIMHPASGTASVLGYVPWKRDPRLLKQISLVVGNKQQLWWDLPAYDSFIVLKELYEVSNSDFQLRLKFLTEELDLADKLSTQVRKLSLGERMKCELVGALLHRPRVLFLDEPTLGLDLVSQKRIREFLKVLNREEGCTMLLTSHYMQDVEELCERVVVIDQGEKIFDGEIDTLVKTYALERRIKLTFSSVVQRNELESIGNVVEWNEDHAILNIKAEDTAHVASLALAQFPVQDISIERVEIEEVIRDLFAANRQK